MTISQKIGTILRETIASPTTASYAVQNSKGDTVVLRQNGVLRNMDLSGADLSGLNLSGITLDHVNLDNANLTETNLCGANLIGASLDGAILTLTRFQGATLKDVTLQNVRFDASPIGLSKEMINAK